jgi:hypothetical protein
LTPAKRDQVVAEGEWLGAAGTVHGTKLALVGLSYGKRLLHLGPPNGSPEVLRKAPPTHNPSEGPARRRVHDQEARGARLRPRVHCLSAAAGMGAAALVAALRAPARPRENSALHQPLVWLNLKVLSKSALVNAGM